MGKRSDGVRVWAAEKTVIPVGPILFIAARAIRASQNGNTPAAAPQPPPNSRGSVTFWSDSGAVGTIILQIVLLTASWSCIHSGVANRSPVVLALGLLAFTFLFPWWVARKILVPLGMAKTAYRVAWLSRVTWRRDRPGGPALAAAWSLAQQDKPSMKTIAWVEEKLQKSEATLQGSTVGAMAFLAAAKGQLSEARALFESVLFLAPAVCPKILMQLTFEWLATDAAAEGDWARAKRFAEHPKSSSRMLTLIGSLASRHLQEANASSFLGVWMWWLMAPRRLWTWNFVRATLSLPPRAKTMRAAAPPEVAADALATALFEHRTAVTTPEAAQLVVAASAWEKALADTSLRDGLFQRSTLLGGGDPDAALTQVRDWVEAELGSHLAAEAPALAATTRAPPQLVESALATQRDVLLTDLETRMERMDRRKVDQRALPIIEEWREVVALRRAYHEVCSLGGISERALAHGIVRDRLVNVAVWHFNDLEEKPLANALFRFLEVEAHAVGDVSGEQLNHKNAACAL